MQYGYRTVELGRIMAKVHYFQRYHTYENAVTNNTLQLLARIYSYAPQKAADFINELVGADEPIEIGLEIHQQRTGLGSIPDGTVIQRSFKIVVETKVDAPVNVKQLERHAGSFSDEEHKILLLLTKQPLGQVEATSIGRAVAASARDVIFSSITFEDVLGALQGLFQPYEYEMSTLVSDYVEYCWDSELVDRSRFVKRWTPVLDKNPLVLKCYHDPIGIGPEVKPATAVAFDAATTA